MHLDNVEMASTNWLYNKSVNALESIPGDIEEDVRNESGGRDTVTSIKKHGLNQASSRHLKTQFSKMQSPPSKMIKQSDGGSEQSQVLKAVLK